MGVPPNHPFLDGFSIINHPAEMGEPHKWKPPRSPKYSPVTFVMIIHRLWKTSTGPALRPCWVSNLEAMAMERLWREGLLARPAMAAMGDFMGSHPFHGNCEFCEITTNQHQPTIDDLWRNEVVVFHPRKPFVKPWRPDAFPTGPSPMMWPDPPG